LKRYIKPKDYVLEALGIEREDILSIHYEIQLNKLFRNEGCRSRKTPDIIYRVEDSLRCQYYLVGEIKSRENKHSLPRALEQSIAYSWELHNHGIPHMSFYAFSNKKPILKRLYEMEEIYENERRNI